MALGIAPEICCSLQAADKGAEKPALQALCRSPAGGRGELRLRSLDSLPLAKPTTGHASRSNSRPVITLPRRGQGSTVARHLLCSAAEHDAGIGRATNGRSSSEKSHCLRSQRLLARPTRIPPPLPAAADARHRPGDEMEGFMTTSHCQGLEIGGANRLCLRVFQFRPLCLVLST
jgi:hypothetical protein